MAEAQEAEIQQFETLGEALSALEQILPEDVRKTYFQGRIWDNIASRRTENLESVIPTPVGLLRVGMFLAVYLINIVCQSIIQELALDQRVGEGRKMVNLTEEEKKSRETVVKTLPDFVQEKLGVLVRIDLTTGQPMVDVMAR